MTRSVAVLGGGMAGLAAAHYLGQLSPHLRVVLIEASHRLGGWVSSTTHPDKVVFEHGPRTLRVMGNAGMNTLALAEDLGLADKVVSISYSHPSAQNRMLKSGNPAVGKSWHWKSPKPLVTPIGPVKSSRIVGGTEATPHSWPHQVALFIDNMYFCGGSLISNEWVLTAAHCMDGAGFVDVVMGAHNIRLDEATQVTMTSTDFFVHENWNSFFLTNDISLIKLPSPVTFDENIQAVNLPSSDVNVGDLVTPTGWGKPSDNALGTSDVLRQVTVPVISNSDCDAVYGIVGEGVVCIDGSGGKSTCNGDSGGPLNKDGFTYGVTSFGSSAGCEENYPAAFTRVYNYLDWIQSNTGITP